MSNTLNPPAVLYLNSDTSLPVIVQITKQLYITEVIDGGEFDHRILSDGYYTQRVHGLQERVLVLREGHETINREYADYVLLYKNNLVYVENTKNGPPGHALPLDHVYLHALAFTG